MTPQPRRPERVRLSYVEQLADRLSPRDWDILDTLDRVRLATGTQLERLHFFSLTSTRSRAVMRWRVLKRLVDRLALVTLERRVGTSLHGSAQLHYVLDSAGHRLIRLRADREASNVRVRRPRMVSERFVAHTRAVTELYVSLIERSRGSGFAVGEFLAEGDAYWPDGLGGWVKADAFIRLDRERDSDYWWYEADMPRHDSEIANESIPTIKGKCLVYLDFVRRGQLGPDGIVPRVLFGVWTNRRREVIQLLIKQLPDPSEALFRVALQAGAATFMVEELLKPNGVKG